MNRPSFSHRFERGFVKLSFLITFLRQTASLGLEMSAKRNVGQRLLIFLSSKFEWCTPTFTDQIAMATSK